MAEFVLDRLEVTGWSGPSIGSASTVGIMSCGLAFVTGTVGKASSTLGTTRLEARTGGGSGALLFERSLARSETCCAELDRSRWRSRRRLLRPKKEKPRLRSEVAMLLYDGCDAVGSG